MRTPQRTLKRVTDLSSGRTITSDELLNLSPDRYQHDIRRASMTAWRERRPLFACEKCGYPVYAPKAPKTRLPYWHHHKGAPHSCPWWSGDTATVTENSANQFSGNQESPLHHWLKHHVGEMLMSDPKTEAGSVVVDEYLITESGRRRPDVRATHDGRNLAVEIQLSSTQLPIIDAREHFYQREGRHLIWVTWNFEPVVLRLMTTAFLDIFYSHNKNLLSLDADLLERSKQERRFLVRAHWERDDNWFTDVFALRDLTWPAAGLPFAVAPYAWHLDFRERWLAVTNKERTHFVKRQPLLGELATRFALGDQFVASPESYHVELVIDTLLSLIAGHPIASRQSHVSEMLNTFLGTPSRHPYARLLRTAATAAGHAELLGRESIKKKFQAAMSASQADRQSAVGNIAVALFPDLFR